MRTFILPWRSRVCFLAALLLLPTLMARAVPYASGVTNNAGTVSFILNESADNVTVLFNGGASNLVLGPLDKGSHSFPLGSATSFEIVVTKSAAAGWTLISSDSNALLQFPSPRGVAVNFNTNSPAFGRIYVANSSAGATTTGRNTGDGLYLLNADQSDAVGQGDTAATGGLVFTSGAQQSSNPWHIEVGPDNFLYIGDFSTNTGTIYRTDADVSPGSGVNIFAYYGITNQSVHTDISSSPIVRGSLAGGDLTVWAIDGRFPGSGNLNRLFRWNINAGPLPHSSAPTPLANPLLTSNPDITTDLDRGPDGKFYLLQNRSAGNEGGLIVVDAAGTSVLWNSLTQSRSISNNPTAVDILRTSRAVKVSPDGSKVAIMRDDLLTWLIPLFGGIPDLPGRELVATYSGAPTTFGRDICFDPAGNLYALSSGNQLLRIFSPGGASETRTRSDGTFTASVFEVPHVDVFASDPVASETGPDSGTFTFTRSGDLSSSLTAAYTLTGTASNGVDYILPLSVMFAVGESNATALVTPVDDSIPELSESVVLTLAAGTNYIPGTNLTATVSIVDNEYPNAVTVVAGDTNMFERFPADTGSFIITRLGDTNVELFLDYSFVGTALAGTDFLSAGAQIVIPPGAVTVNVAITNIDDTFYEGDETIVFMALPGPDNIVGTPGSAVISIRDDEWPPGPVLFADDFETNSAANWLVQFGANNGVADSTNIFAYDYIAAGIPLAPHSAAGSSKGLYLAVNKRDAIASSAGINLYPAGRSFSGDFTLRFDLFLNFGTAGTTEHALAGLNHSGQYTNRVTQSTDAGNTTRGGDGIWVAIETDASVNRDYTAYTTTNQATVPAIIASRASASLTNLITSPPYAFGGSPGNNATSTKAWADVELTQMGSLITLKVNGALVFTVTNTYGYSSGDIMIGHNDQFDSVGSAANYAVFDNVQVIDLSSLRITGAHVSSNQVQIDFTAPSGAAGDFHLQSTPVLPAVSWDDDNSANITATANGFRAVTTATNSVNRFYRIRR